jgi:hypothetical protein
MLLSLSFFHDGIGPSLAAVARVRFSASGRVALVPHDLRRPFVIHHAEALASGPTTGDLSPLVAIKIYMFKQVVASAIACSQHRRHPVIPVLSQVRHAELQLRLAATAA